MPLYYTLLLSALILSDGSHMASACQPGGRGPGAFLDAGDMAFTGADTCLLLTYACPDGEDCIEATQESHGVWSCGEDSADYSLHVGDGDGPYDFISCQTGVSDPKGVSLEDALAANPTVYCQRLVPDEDE